jgi:hypothetical protein
MSQRDFSIRPDLQRLGVPERTIRVLEKAAELTQLIQDAADLQSAVEDISEEQEDQNISLISLDARLDVFEALDPFVRQDQTAAWTAATGTEARTALAAYAGQTISNPPTQAEVQTLDDAVKAIGQHLVALINDAKANGTLT